MRQLAGRYDSMKPDEASKIMINMIGNAQLNDAVMIIYYMQDRQSGKLLAKIGDTEPAIAALLSNKLTRVRESE